MSTAAWSRSPSLWERGRRFTWRWRWPLAVLYLAGLIALVGGMRYYLRRVPSSLDLGATIAARSFAYQQTFDAVERARKDADAGRMERAISRLEHFLDEHQEVQAAQLFTHAVSDAHELLAQLYLATDRSRRAVRTLDDAVQRTPRNYWLWYQKALACQAANDLPEATDALREAFKQTLNHPDVTEEFVGILAEQGLHADLLWAADHFERATQRLAPFVQAKAGHARTPLQRRVLALSGIPIEHGAFGRVCELTGLPRGDDAHFVLPRELVQGLSSDRDIYLLLRFQNIYDDLTVKRLVTLHRNGTESAVVLNPDQVAVLHRPHSGGDYYVEIRATLDLEQLQGIRVEYACPVYELSDTALATVANARRNLAARGAR